MKSFFVFLLVVAVAGTSATAWADETCSKYAQYRGAMLAQHVVCRFSLKPEMIEPMTPEWVKAWVDAHNQFRARAPGATPALPKVTWSAEMARVAAVYASQCVFEHSLNANGIDGYAYVGENLNLFSSNTTAKPIPAFASNVVTAWFNELHAFPADVRALNYSKVGHYTQIVWRNTKAIGCAVAKCPSVSPTPTSLKNNLLTVCMYGPGGNIVGQKPY